MRIFMMWKESTQKLSDPGVWCSFQTKKGKSITFFNNPSNSMDHVCIRYMRERFWNVRQQSQMDFIKQRYKEEIVRFKKQMIRKEKENEYSNQNGTR